jgi:cytochrome b561
MFSFLGWLNVALLAIIVMPYVLNLINKHFLKTKKKEFREFVKVLRSFHKPLGVMLLIIAPIHGLLALGRISLHTGTLLYVVILFAALLGASFYKLKKRTLFLWHKRMGFLILIFLFLHLLYPNALWYLIN